ncbi:MAG: 4a-hydroxytetrahydrobiopterin dehydratase [Stygiobacter sp.]
MKLLTAEEINIKLAVLKNWNYENNSIQKEFTCKDFLDALALEIKIGVIAEKLDHHPDMLLHSWNKLKVTISTHSEGGVTEKDIELAKQIEKLF